LNSSPARWLALPTPIEPYVSVPGPARASAISSATVRAGTETCTVSTIGDLPISPIGAKSLTLS
jgi:hypothetical protein